MLRVSCMCCKVREGISAGLRLISLSLQTDPKPPKVGLRWQFRQRSAVFSSSKPLHGCCFTPTTLSFLHGKDLQAPRVRPGKRSTITSQRRRKPRHDPGRGSAPDRPLQGARPSNRDASHWGPERAAPSSPTAGPGGPGRVPQRLPELRCADQLPQPPRLPRGGVTCASSANSRRRPSR